MRDPRRTPVRVTALREDIASFCVKVLCYEDTGAQWTFPLWQIDNFLCAPATPKLHDNHVAALQTASARLNKPLSILLDPSKRRTTERHLQALTKEARSQLVQKSQIPKMPLSFKEYSAFKTPAVLTDWLSQHDAISLEEDFATRYVSNPHAGETIKAHRLALAELGLCPYEGRVLRDTSELGGDKALPHRMRHILVRLAFLRAAFALLGHSHVTLHRAIYSDSPLTAPRNAGFVSATFSHSVAQRFLNDGATKAHRALLTQQVPVHRLFMTHLETSQMRAPYDEAEALLLCDPAAHIF
ncbi:hypothetical protein J7413_04310 [Shimia sp. R10_1]|uniref:hypothetical protein n=1 Tax=Shimia sp. R10_1 TaxID=2821095 RepID=UPI001ADBEE50|nr:hypothetical protein [Shimia sp. R10_1]MBO9472755.1 hypothetical protein [Shimia sp. R10_1]